MSWWRPDSKAWWTGVLFALGSVCFAAAAIVSQWASVPRPGIGITYFAGSIAFTIAAYLQLTASRRSDDWRAAAIQLAGTVLFNLSTFQAMKTGLDARQSNLRVWAPDVFGSACFLVSSTLASVQVRRSGASVRRRSTAWWIATLNLVGSVAFGVSAVASLIQPSTSEPVSAAIANAGTAIGALCFLAGALLLVRPRAPSATRRARTPPAVRAPDAASAGTRSRR